MNPQLSEIQAQRDKQVIGSIDLDTTPPRRGEITLEDGRLWCDGYDITPREEAYTSIEQARKDVSHLYSVAAWGLELIDQPAEESAA